MLPLLLEMVPAHRRYFEPFLGSGALGFALEPTNAVLGDSNAELMNLFEVIRDNPDELADVMQRARAEVANEVGNTGDAPFLNYLIRWKAIRANGVAGEDDPIFRAAKFLALCHTAYRGRGAESNPTIDQYRAPPSYLYERVLPRAAEILRRNTLMCCDYREIADLVHGGDLVFMDPPYLSGFRYFEGKPNENDHIEVVEFARKLRSRGAYVIITMAANCRPLLDEWWTTTMTLVGPSATGPRHRQEIIAASFPHARLEPPASGRLVTGYDVVREARDHELDAMILSAQQAAAEDVSTEAKAAKATVGLLEAAYQVLRRVEPSATSAVAYDARTALARRLGVSVTARSTTATVIVKGLLSLAHPLTDLTEGRWRKWISIRSTVLDWLHGQDIDPDDVAGTIEEAGGITAIVATARSRRNSTDINTGPNDDLNDYADLPRDRLWQEFSRVFRRAQQLEAEIDRLRLLLRTGAPDELAPSTPRRAGS